MADLRDLADEDLMHLVARSDPRAFEVVYERHSGAAFSLAYRMVGKRSAAEDVVQEAFLNLWRSGARYERTRGSRAHLGARASSTTARSTRCAAPPSTTSAGQATRASPSAWRPRSAPTSRPPAATRRGPCARRWTRLPAEQCQVIELAYFGGFSHSEIAELLETPIGTIKGRMRLGLEKMRNCAGRGTRGLPA